jgi:hypothetical protein
MGKEEVLGGTVPHSLPSSGDVSGRSCGLPVGHEHRVCKRQEHMREEGDENQDRSFSVLLGKQRKQKPFGIFFQISNASFP